MTGTFIDEPIDVAVARAKDAAEGRSVGLLGPGVARPCLEQACSMRWSSISPLSCSAMASACLRLRAASGLGSSQRRLSGQAG